MERLPLPDISFGDDGCHLKMLQKARSPKELQIGENLIKAALNAPEGPRGFPSGRPG